MHTYIEIAVGAAAGGSGSSNAASVLFWQEYLINPLSCNKYLGFSTQGTKHVAK